MVILKHWVDVLVQVDLHLFYYVVCFVAYGSSLDASEILFYQLLCEGLEEDAPQAGFHLIFNGLDLLLMV